MAPTSPTPVPIRIIILTINIGVFKIIIIIIIIVIVISIYQRINKGTRKNIKTDDIVMTVIPSVCLSSLGPFVEAALNPFSNATSFFFDWLLYVFKRQTVREEANAETKSQRVMNKIMHR